MPKSKTKVATKHRKRWHKVAWVILLLVLAVIELSVGADMAAILTTPTQHGTIVQVKHNDIRNNLTSSIPGKIKLDSGKTVPADIPCRHVCDIATGTRVDVHIDRDGTVLLDTYHFGVVYDAFSELVFLYLTYCIVKYALIPARK